MKNISLKLFIILTIFLIIMSIMTINSFGFSTPLTFTDETVGHAIEITELPSEIQDYNYIYIGRHITVWSKGFEYTIRFICSEFPMYTNSDGEYLINREHSGETIIIGSYVLYSTYTHQDYSRVPETCSLYYADLEEFTWSENLSTSGLSPDSDLQYASTSILIEGTDEVFFTGAPLEEEPQVEQTMIATQITSVDFSQVITELLAMLPILLVVLIGLLALRKAIQLLLQTLRRS